MEGYYNVVASAYSVSDNGVGGSQACEVRRHSQVALLPSSPAPLHHQDAIRAGHQQIGQMFATQQGRQQLAQLFGQSEQDGEFVRLLLIGFFNFLLLKVARRIGMCPNSGRTSFFSKPSLSKPSLYFLP